MRKPKKKNQLTFDGRTSRIKQLVNLSSATSEEELAVEEFFGHIMLSYLGTGDRSVSIPYASHDDTFYSPGFSMKIR